MTEPITPDMIPAPQPGLKYSDPALVAALRVMTLCGVVIGLLLYIGLAYLSDSAASRRSIADAAATGLVAAEAEMTRIEVAAERTAPLISAALAEGISPAKQREMRAGIAALFEPTPVVGVAVLDGQGGILSVFGQIPADAAGRLSPVSASRRAGRELFDLQLVPVSDLRAAYYSEITGPDGKNLRTAYVLRTSAFGAALDAAAGTGTGQRAALLNPDGDVVLARAGNERALSAADAALAGKAAGLHPLHADEARAPGRIAAETGGNLLEARPVAGGRLHLVYLAEQRSVIGVIASRKLEFMALFGASMLALVLTLSLIQNEWRREDREMEDTCLVLAQARTSCDLLDAGVIDWSVNDSQITYSDGWAEMFARGVKPASEEAHEWIARIHPEDQEAAREAYQSLLEGEVKDISHRIRIRLPSGLWMQVLERGRAVKGLEGGVARIVLVQTPEAADGSTLKELVNASGAQLPELAA